MTSNLWTGRPAPPYERGLFTMYQEALRDFEQDEQFRYLAVAALAAFAAIPPLASHATSAPIERGQSSEPPHPDGAA